jgi:hypothetical protein
MYVVRYDLPICLVPLTCLSKLNFCSCKQFDRSPCNKERMKATLRSVLFYISYSQIKHVTVVLTALQLLMIC